MLGKPSAAFLNVPVINFMFLFPLFFILVPIVTGMC
jgi:hypothetical protein